MNFKEIYDKSIKKPDEFWREIADDIFWFKKPTKILNKTNPLSTNGMKMVLLILVIML